MLYSLLIAVRSKGDRLIFTCTCFLTKIYVSVGLAWTGYWCWSVAYKDCFSINSWTACDGIKSVVINNWFINILHYSDVIMSVIGSQITSLTIVYSTAYSGIDQRKHQRSTSLAFVRGIHWWLVNSPHKGPVTWKMFHLMMSSWDTSDGFSKVTTHRICIQFVMFCYVMVMSLVLDGLT